MTPNSESVLEKHDRVGCSTFLFQMISQRHRIKQFVPGPWLAPSVKHPTPDLTSGPDLRGLEF